MVIIVRMLLKIEVEVVGMMENSWSIIVAVPLIVRVKVSVSLVSDVEKIVTVSDSSVKLVKVTVV